MPEMHLLRLVDESGEFPPVFILAVGPATLPENLVRSLQTYITDWISTTKLAGDEVSIEGICHISASVLRYAGYGSVPLSPFEVRY